MANPHIWTLKELIKDAGLATDRFRSERLDEPLATYEQLFKKYRKLYNRLIEKLNILVADDLDQEAFANMVAGDDNLHAFRYLTAPPISADDLKTLADCTLSQQRMRMDAEAAERVREIVRHVIDPFRFPWLAKGREPTEEEKLIAVVASASMLAARRMETQRRGEAGGSQEEAVKEVVRKAGFSEVGRRTINLLDEAPNPGEFCPESKLGPTRADVIIRLRDRRVLAIECKVSNSKVNSYKRLNHEALGKATKWLEAYGNRQVVPAAVLTGCFNTSNIADAQEAGLYIFWSHKLDDFAKFLETAV